MNWKVTSLTFITLSLTLLTGCGQDAQLKIATIQEGPIQIHTIASSEAYLIESGDEFALVNGGTIEEIEMLIESKSVNSLDSVILTEANPILVSDLPLVYDLVPVSKSFTSSQTSIDRSFQDFKTIAQTDGRDLITIAHTYEYELGNAIIHIEQTDGHLLLSTNGIPLNTKLD